MHQSNIQFQISQLRQENQTKVMESIMVLILDFIFVSLIPQFLMIYVYQAQTSMMQQPPVLVEFMPVVATVIAVAYVAFAIVTNMMRSSKIRSLETELKTAEMMEDTTSFSSTDEELMALEKIVDDALEQHSPAQTKAKSAKKVSKKKK